MNVTRNIVPEIRDINPPPKVVFGRLLYDTLDGISEIDDMGRTVQDKEPFVTVPFAPVDRSRILGAIRLDWVRMWNSRFASLNHAPNAINLLKRVNAFSHPKVPGETDPPEYCGPSLETQIDFNHFHSKSKYGMNCNSSIAH
ncbi:hypothetical protein N7457_009711 [Penicillium paradoxum]|uniref:uncharacterized protein n=1 Tax=Penicillium paradoxum TaxID=176176 RepID=UPI002548F9DC|nr:uncharacterized protein N7457_009711 [Penicillium paradoxum]KAJ5774815.1 hypothetical protein N7457_009711 [Penicillium paradoxum]